MNDVQVTLPPENSDCTSDLSQWYHCSNNKQVPDDIISKAWDITRLISFMFHHRSAQASVEEQPIKAKKEKKKIIYDDDDCINISEEEQSDDTDDEDYK